MTDKSGDKDRTLHSVSAIVVHHNRYDIISFTISGLIARGVMPDRIVVVDNSEDESRRPELVESLPDGIDTLFVENAGYGAAVNRGLRHIAELQHPTPYTLVTTHEVEFAPGGVDALVNALDADEGLVAVGPVLRGALPDGAIWSAGGEMSRVLRLPRHRANVPSSPTRATDVALCDWLDGAAVLYRSSALPVDPFDEGFFMYMEEVDLHLRLALAGGRVGIALSSTASQQSDGTPPFYFSRSIRLLNRRHSSAATAWVRSSVAILRRGLGNVRRRRFSDVRELVRGAICPLPPASDRVVIVNPLGSALKHYVGEVQATLVQQGVGADTVSILEPSAGGYAPAGWIARYVVALRAARRLQSPSGSMPAVVTWPTIGFFDALLVRTVLLRGSLVFHDPHPLVRSIGYGRVTRAIAARALDHVTLITHSRAAERDLSAQVNARTREHIVRMPHPMMPRAIPAVRREPGLITVVGQYKADRDLDVMRYLAAHKRPDWQLEVHGRGWPQLEGWNVNSAFLSEAEFDHVLVRSAVTLIPYRRFYQSGVAIRAIELGTPVVGPRESSLSELLGDSKWLTTPELHSWIVSIEAASRSTEQMVSAVQNDTVQQSRQGWEDFINGKNE